MGTKVFLFRDGRYARYDRLTNATDDGYPRSVAGNWAGLAEVGFEQPDSALNLEAGKLFFFKSDSYVRYDVAADGADAGYPLRIADQWPGLGAAGFGSDVNAAINWGNGKAYFFKGDSYLRYDIVGNRADDGYPLRIADRWPGLDAAGFAFGPRAVIDLFDGRDLWLPTAERMPGTKNGPNYIALPWRGVLHTTEGPTIDGALQTFRATNFWPTLTIEPNTFRIVQHYSLNKGARALSDHATAENAARCVQIEIVGFAAQTPELGARATGVHRRRRIRDRSTRPDTTHLGPHLPGLQRRQLSPREPDVGRRLETLLRMVRPPARPRGDPLGSRRHRHRNDPDLTGDTCS